MDTSTYAALRRAKFSGSWSSGKKDVKDASGATVADPVTSGLLWTRHVQTLDLCEQTRFITCGHPHLHSDVSQCNHRRRVCHCIQGAQVCCTLQIRCCIFTQDLQTKPPTPSLVSTHRWLKSQVSTGGVISSTVDYIEQTHLNGSCLFVLSGCSSSISTS